MLERRVRRLKRQLQECRYRLNHMYDDFAIGMYSMSYFATKDIWRISTNGDCIIFNPDWLEKLGPKELDFIMCHQLMHIQLGHIFRPSYYWGDRYHLAADIVANGHLNQMGWNYEKLSNIGKIRYETFIPTVKGYDISSIEAIKCVPFDPSTMSPGKRRQFMIDSDTYWDKKSIDITNCTLILSPLDNDPDDLRYDGPTFGGDFNFTKEEFSKKKKGADVKVAIKVEEQKIFVRRRNSSKATTAINNLRQSLKEMQLMIEDDSMDRKWTRMRAENLDWKILLDAFIQEEVFDYSFTPPDRRVQNDFFLPEYNVNREAVRNILFMVDTSGSISDEIMGMAYDEICQAVEQFDGILEGEVAFFDTTVYRSKKFSVVDDITKLKPYGGGGTNYECIFNYIFENRYESIPTSIVIITDGEGLYPKESIARGIPVLWLLTGDEVAPWGKNVMIK
ncbi:DUF2201 family putative metallopeptidase [Pseudobutyrivibrio sp. LB2011]|uniref:DUF2201 family putative metallopeptidase n=1 Tax=Pseudobutyrivibrio sp. LB2011 TaxID=1408312 RepID=UPI0005D1A5F9|nr:VWA-like domain-containing protein [Pseudobutyrivibrio sp. LB2011]